MHINFDEYSPYSSTISEKFETNVNADIQCDHSYAYASSKEKFAHGLMRKVGK